MPHPRLSVLDQSPIPDGSSASAAFAETIALARLADRLGYERYWLAEHHNPQGRVQPIERFGQQLSDLAGFLYDALPPDHPYHHVHATPRSAGAPEMWLLGSGGDSAAYAAVLGFAFSYAHFINPNAAEESLST